MLITGGDIGDVAAHVAAAREMIGERIGKIVAASGVRESGAWGFEAEGRFLNQVLVVETGLSPEGVLAECGRIEDELGRTRPEKGVGDGRRVYASRTMDIDILFYGDRVIGTAMLTVPHPLIAQRRFVLEPLAEVMPDFVHPVLGKSVARLLAEHDGK